MRSQTHTIRFLLAGLLLGMIVLASAPAGAVGIMPHRFYGSVTIGGLPAPAGTHITATVEGGVGDNYVMPVSGTYGTGFMVPLFSVQPVGEASTLDAGDPITFYVNGVKAEVYEVGKGPWMDTYPFADDGLTNLDLRISGSSGSSHTIIATAGTGGSISPSGNVVVPNGGSQTFTINPATGYTVQDVVVDGVSKGPVSSYPFNSVTADHTITATFTLIQTGSYTISATAGAGGSISPSGSVAVAEGGSSTFTISPDSCHTVQDVLVDGVSQGAITSFPFTNVDSDHTIAATFVPKTVYVTANAGTGGSINPSGQQSVECGGQITFTITPATGYTVQDVMVDGISKGPVSSYPFDTVTADHTISATFSPTVTYTIEATAGQNGTITPSGSISVVSGADQSFTMVPDTNFSVDQILVDGSPVTVAPGYTFENVAADHTISVTFREGAPDYFVVPLGDGWNLFSTPIKLEPGHQNLENIFSSDSLDHIEVILGWDGSTWFIPGNGYEMTPLTAVYVKVQDSATALLYPSKGVSMPPSRALTEGWNLVGPAPGYDDSGFEVKTVEQSLVTAYGDPANQGYLIVISPGLNQPAWSYVRDGADENMRAFNGYWIFMDNPMTLQGFSTTPIS